MNEKNEQGNHSLPVGRVREGSLDDYILAHIDKESDYLHRLWRATQLHLLYDGEWSFAGTTLEDVGGDDSSEVGAGDWYI